MESTVTATPKTIQHIQIGNDLFYKISDSNKLRPFFMSIVSDSNHWMFISSNGGLSAGRKNSDYALFPYYTDDKITESAEITGSKTIFHISKAAKTYVWEPFSDRYHGEYAISRNLYKNEFGNKVLFEEVNHDLELTFRYEWNTSDQYGFVRLAKIINNASDNIEVNVLDGIQNILPYGVNSDLQNGTSNLVDAYKRNEIEPSSGLGIYSLSAIIVDRAEPSEALKANIAYAIGLDNPTHLLSSLQLPQFRNRHLIYGEKDVKAEKGAYLINSSFSLAANAEKNWMIIANVNQNHAAIAKVIHSLKNKEQLENSILNDIEQGTKKLIKLTAAADGFQQSSDQLRDTRHYSNVLFNIMRGGIFDHDYQIEKDDLIKYLSKANQQVASNLKDQIESLPAVFTLSTLNDLVAQNNDVAFKRLCLEYLPLKFSRRHGDPSRPWNKFSINTQDENDGSKVLDYQGNWRDIFQNWEALAHAYPAFIESMICKFLNASTFDGYNPYRVTKDGFDWESIEPDNPWSYIGYWGDHQIIYLQKFLEIIENYYPGKLENYFEEEIFVYANVPYKIKSYEDILSNSKDTIEFDHELDHKLRIAVASSGADAALIKNKEGNIYTVNFLEKILASLLAKLSNFIPEGGIWMNTQRPEWNDANNALVGNGVSMVTLYYIGRFLTFFDKLLSKTELDQFKVSAELKTYFNNIAETLDTNKNLLSGNINDQDRKQVLDGLGKAASDYRQLIYAQQFSGNKQTISLADLKQFIKTSLHYVEHTIKANKRSDELYHAYNLMTVESEDSVSISYLSEMLEGQVAALSSKMLSSEDVLKVLDGLKASKLFREDQYSYLLYPNKNLPGFLEKNTLDQKAVETSTLLMQLLEDENLQVIEKDINGSYHFNGNFKNAQDLQQALNNLDKDQYGSLIEKDQKNVLQIFEQEFNHKAFTGRSGTFFGYEGLGSIYWHMVSKLQLAVQECCIKAINEKADDATIGRLLEHYYEINEGIGVHKSPSLYGAFSTDPYSHTPAGKGAQQPGMTGQVKEDILCRFGELGVFVKNGQLYFNPCLLRQNEFLTEDKTFNYVSLTQEQQQLKLNAGSLGFTYCQVPVIYHMAEKDHVEVLLHNETSVAFEGLTLNTKISDSIFNRTNEVKLIKVYIQSSRLK